MPFGIPLNPLKTVTDAAQEFGQNIGENIGETLDNGGSSGSTGGGGSNTGSSPNFFDEYTGGSDSVSDDPVQDIRDNLGIDNDAPTGTDPTNPLPDEENGSNNPVDQKIEDLVNPLPSLANIELPAFKPGGSNDPDQGGDGSMGGTQPGMAGLINFKTIMIGAAALAAVYLFG